MSKWTYRVGWARFFERAKLPFTEHHVEDWRGGRNALNQSSHVHFKRMENT